MRARPSVKLSCDDLYVAGYTATEEARLPSTLELFPRKLKTLSPAPYTALARWCVHKERSAHESTRASIPLHPQLRVKAKVGQGRERIDAERTRRMRGRGEEGRRESMPGHKNISEENHRRPRKAKDDRNMLLATFSPARGGEKLP